ncbi:MAG TPA: FtsX-like permease family protein [Anaerolineae bacterium]|nr:FtsX-like permease family protein [Anaerolineae bacterium]
MGQTFKLAWRNMWRNWRRTMIALVAIVLGLILLLLFDGIIRGSDQAIFGNAVRVYGGNLQVHAPGYRDKAARLPMLPLDDPAAVVQAAKALPDVQAVSERINTAGIIINHGTSVPVMITALQPDVEAPISLQAENVSQGRFLKADDGDAIFIGKALADRLGVGVGDNVTLLGRSKNESMRQHNFNVVGIYDLHTPDAEKGTVFIPLADAQTLYNLRDQVTEVPIFLKQIGGEAAVMTALQNQLPNYEIDSWQTLKGDLKETLDAKFAYTSFFGIVVIVIASIGILNLMLMAVFERTREMGVLAALGMKGRRIMSLFLLEGSLIGVVGAIIGSAFGLLFIALMGSAGLDFSKMTSGMGEVGVLMSGKIYPTITVGDLVIRFIIVVIIAMLASLYPAWQASRKEPAKALHHV